jgi:4-hydroxy-3-polyprenylbenzoate decarboxylase
MSGHVVVIGVNNNEGDVVNKIKEALPRIVDHPIVIIVDEAVDVFNLDEVFYALATKCHPLRGIEVHEREMLNPLMNYWSSPQEREARREGWVLFDCTWPPDWPRDSYVPQRMSFGEAYPQGIREKVIKEWKNYGFE